MHQWLFVLAVLCSGIALAQLPYYHIGEAFSVVPEDRELGVGGRVHTAPSLTETRAVGEQVAWLEIEPTEIRIPVGGLYSLHELRVFAHSRTGEILPRIPLSLSIEGPEDLLDLERLATDGHELRGVRPGLARLWIESLVPGRNGENPREAIVLVVHEQEP